MERGDILPRGTEFPITPRGLRIPEKVPDEYHFSDYLKSSMPQKVPATSIETSCRYYLNQALVNCRPAFPSAPALTPRTNASEFRLCPTAIDLSFIRERCPPLRGAYTVLGPVNCSVPSLRGVASHIPATIATSATQAKSPRFEPHRLSLASDHRLVTMYNSPAHEKICATLPTFDNVITSGYGRSSSRRHNVVQAARSTTARDASEVVQEIGQFEERLVTLNLERRSHATQA